MNRSPHAVRVSVVLLTAGCLGLAACQHVQHTAAERDAQGGAAASAQAKEAPAALLPAAPAAPPPTAPIAEVPSVSAAENVAASSAAASPGSASPHPTFAMIETPAKPKGNYAYSDQDYPAEARQLGIEGKIRVRLTVSDEGKVTAATLLNQLGHGLDEVALSKAKRLEFDPAKDTNDRPVASFVIWTFIFTLPASS